MSTWIDYTVITVVIAVGLAIFYKALKEPIDLVGSLIARGISGMYYGISDRIHGMREGSYVETISYG